MKIVNIQEFMKLPKGTLFCVYRKFGYEFLNLMLKDDNWTKEGPYNFFFQDLHEVDNDGRERVKILDKAVKKGTSFSFDLSEPSRIGQWDEDTLFAVYEQADIMKLMAVLCTAHNDAGIAQKSLGNATLTPFGPVTPPTYMSGSTSNPVVGHVNFLVAGQFERLPILGTQWDMERLGIPYVVMEKMPTPLADFVLEVDMRKSFCSKVMVYVTDKADVADLARELSAKGYHVSVKYQGHVLQTWDNGAEMGPRKTISWVHGTVSKEEDDLSRF